MEVIPALSGKQHSWESLANKKIWILTIADFFISACKVFNSDFVNWLWSNLLLLLFVCFIFFLGKLQCYNTSRPFSIFWLSHRGWRNQCWHTDLICQLQLAYCLYTQQTIPLNIEKILRMVFLDTEKIKYQIRTWVYTKKTSVILILYMYTHIQPKSKS